MRRKLKILFIIILIPISLETYIRFKKNKAKVIHHTEYPASTKKFLDAISKIESGGNPKIISSTGYLGKYQFSPATIKGLGFKVSSDSFLKNEELQDSVMICYMLYNSTFLAKFINDCDGYRMGNDNVMITRSGILAGSHTHGAGAVIMFLKSNGECNICDGNGISLSKRMKQFENIYIGKL